MTRLSPPETARRDAKRSNRRVSGLIRQGRTDVFLASLAKPTGEGR